MTFYLDSSSLIWIIILAIMVGCLFGAGIGYYAAEKDHEHKQQKILDNVAHTPYFAEKANTELVRGYVAGSIIPIPGVGAYSDNVDPIGQTIYNGQATAQFPNGEN